MADHEIRLLGSDACRDVAHRGAFHGRNVDTVTTLSPISKRWGDVLCVKGGDQIMKYLPWILAAVEG